MKTTKQSDSNLGPKQSKFNVRQKKRKKSLKKSAKNISLSSSCQKWFIGEKKMFKKDFRLSRRGGLDSKKKYVSTDTEIHSQQMNYHFVIVDCFSSVKYWLMEIMYRLIPRFFLNKWTSILKMSIILNLSNIDWLRSEPTFQQLFPLEYFLT